MIRRSCKGGSFSVARNAIIDHYRTRKKTSELPESLPAELPEELRLKEKELRTVLPPGCFTACQNHIGDALVPDRV